MGEVRVNVAGLLTTIQDAKGRPGLGRFGIPRGGAMDAAAAQLANRLVGNHPDAPLLEITMHGPTLEWPTGALVGLAGADLGAVIGGRRLAPGLSYRVPAGGILRFDGANAGPGFDGAALGARTYLAVDGGFAVKPVLGSASTDRRSGFGGLEGRALRDGDVLRFNGDGSGPVRSAIGPTRGPDVGEPLLVIPTPASLGWFAPSAVLTLFTTSWTVAPASDRSGILLTGGRIAARAAGIASLGVPVGSIQVPPSGEPIITMADGPVTGGYPVIGVVPRFEIGRLAQLGPGAAVRFARSSVRVARLVHAERDREAPIDLDEGDFAASWAQ